MQKPLISIGELIDQSWDIYRVRVIEFLSISGWFLITALLFAIALTFYPSASKLQLGADLTNWETTGVLIFSFTSMILTPILSFWIYTSLTKAVGTHLARRTLDAKTALKEGYKILIPALRTSVMVMLMVLLAVVIGFAPAIILATIGSLAKNGFLIILANVLLIFGILVALVLSVKWVVYYLLAPTLTILDGTPAKLALATSRQLIQGRFWSVLLRIAIPKIVFIIFGVFAMAIIAYLISILLSLSAGINIDLQVRIGTMTETIVPIVIAAILNPLIIISDVLLLRSLRQS